MITQYPPNTVCSLVTIDIIFVWKSFELHLTQVLYAVVIGWDGDSHDFPYHRYILV